MAKNHDLGEPWIVSRGCSHCNGSYTTHPLTITLSR